MEIASETFKANAAKALHDGELQRALLNVPAGFIDKRLKARERLPEFEALREEARDLKNHVLRHLDLYLERYEAMVKASGGVVHYAPHAADARKLILDIARRLGARSVTKGKSMVGEEIEINEALTEAGITPVETDLGEYIIQLRGEHPSHIIAPAVHLTRQQVEADFRRAHRHLPEDRNLDEAAQART